MRPEPDNAYDSKTVAFQCHVIHQKHLQSIGHVVAEVCEEVLSANDGR